MRKTEEQRFREFARDQSAALRRTGYLLCDDWHRAPATVAALTAELAGKAR